MSELDNSLNYRLFPIGLAKHINNKVAMTYLNLLFKSDFKNGKSNVLLETLADMSGYNTETISTHLHKIQDTSDFLKIERTCVGIVNGKPKTKNFYTSVIPTKDFIIVDKSYLDYNIDGLTKKEQHEIKGFILLVKCLCVNNTNMTFYSLRQMAQRIGLSYATIQNLMKLCKSRGFIAQQGNGYEIKLPHFSLGNDRQYPNGTPTIYKSIYKTICDFCLCHKIKVPPYKADYISKIAARFPYTENDLEGLSDDIKAQYSVRQQLDKRLPTPPQEIESLNYFVKVLTSGKIGTSNNNENPEYYL